MGIKQESKSKYFSLKEVCSELSISYATGRNWVKLGKIIPDINGIYFSSEYVKNCKKQLISGKSLKSRRNKKQVSGNKLYDSYVGKNSPNISAIKNILDYIEQNNIDITDSLICSLISQCFKNFCKTIEYECSSLIKDIEKFGGKIDIPQDLLRKIKYIGGEDSAGLLYISLKNLQARKSLGAYYTPSSVIKVLYNRLFTQKQELSNKTVLDPCCGTGNFLLNLPNDFKPENIYACDIDPMSVLIARLNLAIKYKIIKTEILYKNIKICDYLKEKTSEKYDFIVGNPPWGFEFSQEDKLFLKKHYLCAKTNTIESYDVVLEKSLSKLKVGGFLSFILPEAILNTKSHYAVRSLIMQKNSIQYIEYLGEIFSGVQCSSIILQILNNNTPLSTRGLIIKYKANEYVIKTKRNISAENFNFPSDIEYKVLLKIKGLKNVAYLKNNAKFALGIVTGDNDKYLSAQKTQNNEPVLKGKDIQKFSFENPKLYIDFQPDRFQQTAPVELYRAKEKLLYKFITGKLAFAYDNKQTLSLNSCNILIPEISGLHIKYIMAILNSSIAQFYFDKEFNSVKILRSHIEQIPIPRVSEYEQKKIINLVNRIINGNKILFKDLDKIIADLYNLTDKEYYLISHL